MNKINFSENTLQESDGFISDAIEADQRNVEKDEVLFACKKSEIYKIAEMLPHHYMQLCFLS